MWGLKETKSSKSKKSNPKTNFLYFHFHFQKYGMSSVIRMYGFKPEESSEELATSSIFGIFCIFLVFLVLCVVCYDTTLVL
jgi:hypothetical protein